MRARVRIADGGDAVAAMDLLRGRGWEITTDDLTAPDVLVVDEWTPESDPHVVRARRGGTRVTVLAELLLDAFAGRIVAVTGTAGKTSTCRALAHILAATGHAVTISSTARSANAWPDRSFVVPGAPDAVAVAELTSTHLCHMDRVRADAVVVTTIRPDHAELHGGLDRYYSAKRRIVDHASPDAARVLPVDDPQTLAILGITDRADWGFGAAQRPEGDGAFLTGDGLMLRSGGLVASASTGHSGTGLRALLAASAAALAMGCRPERVAAALPGIPDVAHRMTRRALQEGVLLIDDTMAATPLKGLAGVEEAPGGPVVVVVGGSDAPGGIPVHATPDEDDALRGALRSARLRALRLIAFGPAAARIAAHVEVDARVGTISDAIDEAVTACPRGGTILVAPMFPMSPADREFVAGLGASA